MRWMPVAALIAIAAFATPAAAQVHRCKDAAGHLTYSDRPCDAGKTGRLVERRKSSGEIYRERVTAYNAEMVKQERNTIAAEREMREQQQRAMQVMNQQPALPQQKGFAERLAERNASVKSNLVPHHALAQPDPDAYGDQDPPARGTSTTHCKGDICYDERGVPSRMKGKASMVGPDGRICRRSGNFLNCN